ncbi:MAG: hypothetical protein FWF11_00210 [Coriobacteriia bacterium]|nr:hypothetical protein [Coriobacteriia bacterium]
MVFNPLVLALSRRTVIKNEKKLNSRFAKGRKSALLLAFSWGAAASIATFSFFVDQILFNPNYDKFGLGLVLTVLPLFVLLQLPNYEIRARFAAIVMLVVTAGHAMHILYVGIVYSLAISPLLIIALLLCVPMIVFPVLILKDPDIRYQDVRYKEISKEWFLDALSGMPRNDDE